MADGSAPVLEADVPLHAATLRYFVATGSFGDAVAAAVGAPLPAPLTALVVPATAPAAAGVLLAWLRPTETLALSETAAPVAELKERLAGATGGCIVELSGALRMMRVSGAGAAELLRRLGSAALVPSPGQALRGRLADVTVLALSIRTGEVLLLVDRAYAAHLTDWIGATLADWTDAG